MEKRQGEAYAIVNCSASREELERELPFIRQVSRLPGKLELRLGETKDVMASSRIGAILDERVYSTYPSKHRGLMAKAKPTRLGDLKYTLEARCPGATSRETAQMLGDVVNGAYTVFDDGSVFTGAIVGKSDDGSKFWEYN